MINRILIRAKVVQMLYAYMVSKEAMTLTAAKKELKKSLDKSYELYNAMLKLIIELTDVQDLRLDEAKYKFLPTEEDLHPDMRFVENELIERLRSDATLADYVESKKINWRDDELFVRLLLDKVIRSEAYTQYMAGESTAGEMWMEVMKSTILTDENLLEHLQSKSVYFTDDDLQIVGEFVVKTIKRFAEGAESPLLPQNNALIDQFVKSEKWDVERIALMDRLVMNAALSEIRHFPSIPVNVSLNEYIELAKLYSTPKSGKFVNGILNAAVKELRSHKQIMK